jgi:hypothetical protein
MLRRRSLIPAALGALAAPGLARAQGGPPHAWTFGTWVGGIFPAVDTEGAVCFGSPVLVFTRDVVLRVTSLEVTFRQRIIETVAETPTGLEFRFVPIALPGGRMVPELGFGCDGNPNILRVERRGPDEIVLPGCTDFPATLRRCVTPR